MFRLKMYPIKMNFPDRWGQSKLCTFCCEVETYEHLFRCPGYLDLHKNDLRYDTFMKIDCEMAILSKGAKVLLKKLLKAFHSTPFYSINMTETPNSRLIKNELCKNIN